MHFPLFTVLAALFATIVNCLPLDSADQELFLPDLISSGSFSELTADSNILADVNSYTLNSNDVDIPKLDLLDPSSSEGLIASSNVGDSDFNPLLRNPDDEANFFNLDSTASNTFSDSMVGSDVLEDSQNWLEPSLTLAGNPQAPSANQVSVDDITVCCGHGESLQYYCETYDKNVQTCTQASILCPADSSLAQPFDRSRCHPDPESRENIDERDDFWHALGDTIWHNGARVGLGLIVCKLVTIIEFNGWKCE